VLPAFPLLRPCSITAPRSVVALLYGSREIALGCISKACRAHGWPLDVSSAAGTNYSYVPVVSQERLAGVHWSLYAVLGWAGLGV
jgi:hypothetical protein